MTIPLDDLEADLRDVLEDALGDAREQLKDLQPDLESLVKRAAAYGLTAAGGVPAEAKTCLEELRHQAGLLSAIIVKRGESVAAYRLERGVDILAKFLALLLKRML